MKKVRHIKDLRATAARALFTTAEVKTPTSIDWSVAGKCEQPVNFTLEGRHHEYLAADEWGDAVGLSRFAGIKHGGFPMLNVDAPSHAPLFVDLTVRCRRCPWCLKQRAKLWSLRARAEIHAASRTWFGTMTLRPQEHWLASCRAEVAMARTGVKWAELSPDEQFQALHAENSKEITKWLKRIRKESASRLRYFLVAEAHKSGLPHYHILVHERWLGGTVTERTMRHQWKLGHSKFNLVHDAGASWYVAKYLAKASRARVRASERYGQSVL